MNEGTTQAWFSTVIKQRNEEKYVFTAAQYFIPFLLLQFDGFFPE